MMRTVLAENAQELEMARRLQEHTQPRHAAELPGYLVFARTIPATWGNGDFFDIIGVSPREGTHGFTMDLRPQVDHLVVSMGDATGHGMGAALMATSLTSMLRISIRLGVYHRNLVAALNAQLFTDFPDDHFITLLLGRLDRARNMFRWVSFGQGPLWLHREKHDSVEALEPHHPPLGVLPDVLDYSPTETFFEPGDTLLAVSDGFHETRNPSQELVGESALLEVFREVAAQDPDTIFQHLWSRIQSHAGGLSQEDDRTFLLIRRLK